VAHISHRAPAAAAIAAALALSGCGVNPVTGKKEIQFVSEAQEIAIGEKQYAPTQQIEGGDLVALPELSAYVSEVGGKLAAVSDRPLPYEFVVLDNSQPNAWALPGGKIAINRGLLTALQSESELAAVLGHEIVHAAARHGAKAQERGTLLQAGVAVAQIGAMAGGLDAGLANMAVGGASVGAQMIQQKYGRDQELEADLYGMRYMKLAGYDPWGAVTLQETFVRLFNQGSKEQNWMEGLFASHPPSQDRVAHNIDTAEQLGRGGITGADTYAARLKGLRQMQPAYDRYDAALKAANQKELDKARTLAGEAVKLAPNEGRFHQLLGDIAVAQKDAKGALPHFAKAQSLNPGYYGSWLGAGIAQYSLGNRPAASSALEQSANLLPTAPAAYYLGRIASDSGRQADATKYYQLAAQSSSSYGKLATAELMKTELPQNPGKFIAAAPQVGSGGRAVVVIENRAPVAVADIVVTPFLVDAAGNVSKQGNAVRIAGPIAPGQRGSIDAGVGTVSAAQIQYLRLRIDSARLAQ
jgi:predicted Zn-dependent protease